MCQLYFKRSKTWVFHSRFQAIPPIDEFMKHQQGRFEYGGMYWAVHSQTNAFLEYIKYERNEGGGFDSSPPRKRLNSPTILAEHLKGTSFLFNGAYWCVHKYGDKCEVHYHNNQDKWEHQYTFKLLLGTRRRRLTSAEVVLTPLLNEIRRLNGLEPIRLY